MNAVTQKGFEKVACQTKPQYGIWATHITVAATITQKKIDLNLKRRFGTCSLNTALTELHLNRKTPHFCACTGSLWVLQLPPTAQKHARQINW